MPDNSLKERLTRDSILVVPAAFDMVSAKVIERAGFEAVYLSGFGQSASHLGLPDAGLMTLSEIVERVHNMARAIKVPLLADGDTGYGGVINVRRTVQAFEWAGASAIQLEDQEIPVNDGVNKRVGEIVGPGSPQAEPALADPLANGIEAVAGPLLERDDEVVSQALHLGELQFHPARVTGRGRGGKGFSSAAR